jgi:hypothetical protein
LSLPFIIGLQQMSNVKREIMELFLRLVVVIVDTAGGICEIERGKYTDTEEPKREALMCAGMSSLPSIECR